MKKIKEIKEILFEKNSLTMSNGGEWFLYNPFGIDYPCYIEGGDGEIVDLEKNLKGNHEIISWIFEGEGQEVDGIICYFQVPVLKQV